jgi:HlyD family secretion protein
MSKLKIAVVALVLATVGGWTWFHQRGDGKEAVSYRTTPVTRASIKSTVSATGALQAVRTVQVGTQVSGQISQIYVDFNDKVKKGQLIARIDPTLPEAAVQDAQAQLEKAQAQLKQAQDDYARNKTLFDQRVITAAEFGTSQSTFNVQQATVKSAQIALDRAKQQLSYTSIYAPIDGVIVERNVDVGQTVAASLSAPQLFLIANDLSEMQILASVDESDIGQIKEGQPVQFTVQSYPGQTFTGTVKQVRLQSTTTDNIVNYTAVIGVGNASGKLLPGMTATVQFLTASADNVLTVPNMALHITPTAEMLAQTGMRSGTRTGGQGGATQDSARGSAATTRAPNAGNGNATPGATARTGRSQARPSSAILWTLAADKKTVKPVRVHIGLTDGQRTEVTSDALTEGTQVITSVVGETAATTTSGPTQNPFQPARGGPRGGRF